MTVDSKYLFIQVQDLSDDWKKSLIALDREAFKRYALFIANEIELEKRQLVECVCVFVSPPI